MREGAFTEAVMDICQKDSRYDPEAYFFVREALDLTVGTLDKPRKQGRRHVRGDELLDGLRRYALQAYGPMAIRVLNSWGVEKTEDFGEIVFNMVDAGVLGSTAEDKKEDFAGGFDFHKAFEAPYIPRHPHPCARRGHGVGGDSVRQGNLRARRTDAAEDARHLKG